MTNSKKYAYQISQDDASWKAQITRQITSKKTVVSKEQTEFKSEAEATKWAEAQLQEFAGTLETRNKRHAARRKQGAGEREDRSKRRADKTLQAKQVIKERTE